MIKSNFYTTLFSVIGLIAIQGIGCNQNKNLGEFGARFRGGGSFIGCNPILTPEGTRVIFSSPTRTTVGDLCSLNTDGTSFTRILSEPFYEGFPEVSPCGKYLAYVSEAEKKPHLYVLELGTQGVATRVTKGNWTELSPRYSHDGKKIAFCRQMSKSPDDALSCEVIVVDLASQTETRVTNDRYGDTPVGFSTDDKWLYFESLRLIGSRVEVSLWKKQWEDKEGEAVQVLPFSYKGVAVVLPNDRGFVFLDDRQTPYNYEIYKSSPDGSQVEQLTKLETYIGNIRYGKYQGQDAVTFVADSERRGVGIIHILLIDSRELLTIGSNLPHQ